MYTYSLFALQSFAFPENDWSAPYFVARIEKKQANTHNTVPFVESSWHCSWSLYFLPRANCLFSCFIIIIFCFIKRKTEFTRLAIWWLCHPSIHIWMSCFSRQQLESWLYQHKLQEWYTLVWETVRRGRMECSFPPSGGPVWSSQLPTQLLYVIKQRIKSTLANW